MKQILLQLDDTGRERFIIKVRPPRRPRVANKLIPESQELDDTHVLISAEHLTRIKEELQVELEKNNYVALDT